MSAYIVDPRTIDYLVQWAAFHASRDASVYVEGKALAQAAAEHGQAMQYGRLYIGRMEPDALGQLLMRENARSVGHRYADCAPDDLPGPNDQTRVWRYRFRPVNREQMRAGWVIQSCACLDYQSCETDDWKDTLAYAVLQGIRESAVDSLTDGAPWGVTDDDLLPQVAK